MMENYDVFKVVECYKDVLRKAGFSELELRVVVIDMLKDMLNDLECEKIDLVLAKMEDIKLEDIEDV